MTLANPWWLALAVPVWALIVMLHTRQRARVVVPSLLGWERSGSREARHQRRRLPPWSIPLALQLLAVAMVALALAEPSVGSSDNPHVIVFVAVSDAASANEALRDVVARVDPRAEMSIVDVRGTARPVVAFARPARALVVARERLLDNDALPRWDEAARTVTTLGVADVTVVTVVAADDAGPSSFVGVDGVDVDVLRVVGAAARPSVGVVGVGFVHDDDRGGWLHAQVRNRSLDAINVDAVVSSADGTLVERAVSLAPDTAQWLEWRIDDDVTGVLDVTFTDVDGDIIAYGALAVDAIAPVRVRVIGSPMPFLERVLAALPDVELTRVSEYDPMLPPVDLEIVHGDVPVGAMRGHRAYIAGVPRDLRAGAPIDGPWQMVLAAHHPLLAPGAAEMFDVAEIVPARVRQGAAVLAWAEGWPAVQAVRLAEGAEVVVAFGLEGPSEARAEWSVTSLVVRLLQWIEPGLGSGAVRACRVAAPCAIPERGGRDLRIYDPTGRAWAPVHLEGRHADAPSTRAVSSFDPWFVPRSSGWHRIELMDSSDVALWVTAEIPWEHPVEDGDEADLGVLSGGGAHAVYLDPWRLAAGAAVLVALWTGWRGMGLHGRRMRVRFLMLSVATIIVILGLAGTIMQWPLPRGAVSETWSVVVQPSVPPEAVAGLQNAANVVVASSEVAIVSGDDVDRLREYTQEASSRVGVESGSQAGEGLAWARALALASNAGRVAFVSSALPVDGPLIQWLSMQTVLDAVDVARLRPAHGHAVYIRDAHVLGRAWHGATVRVAVTLDANVPASVEVRVGDAGRRLATLPTQLSAGVTTLLVDVGVSDVGHLELELVDVDRLDAPLQRADVPIIPSGPLRVAVVADQVAWSLLFAQLLEVHGIDAFLVDPGTAPRDPSQWRDVDAIVLYDLPAIALDTAQQRAIASWVELEGGGVLIAGGENAFGPGGYHLAVLDQLSPLAAEIPMDRPDVAVVFVLDRSGSMVQAVGETTRLEIAREATWEAITLLDPRSQVGIVVFDSASTLIQPVRTIDDRAAVRRSLDLLTAGGGTALYPALVQAHGAISQIQDVPRHVVVMTDGLTQSGDFDGIMAEYVRDQITVSTVAIGRGASYPRLRLIAQESGGTFYESVDFTLLPSIMAQEILMLTADAVVTESFEGRWTATPGEFSRDLDWSWPVLTGMVRTTPKDEATVHAVGLDGDALLASWEVGLGRVVAFTSQPIGPWSLEWLQQAELPRLWAQAVRWSAAASTSQRLQVFARPAEDGIDVDAVARRQDGRPATALPLVVVPMREDAKPHPLQEREPGVYGGRVSSDVLGEGPVRVMVVGDAPNWPSLDVGLRPGSRAPLGHDRAETAGLLVLSSLGGGRLVESTSDLISPGARAWLWEMTPQWRSWLLASLAGLLLALVSRYARRRPDRAVGGD